MLLKNRAISDVSFTFKTISSVCISSVLCLYYNSQKNTLTAYNDQQVPLCKYYYITSSSNGYSRKPEPVQLERIVTASQNHRSRGSIPLVTPEYLIRNKQSEPRLYYFIQCNDAGSKSGV